MIRFITTIVMGLCAIAHAQKNFSQQLSINSKSIQKVTISEKNLGTFTEVQFQGFDNTRELGAPALPVKTWLLKGTPESIRVQLQVNSQQLLKNMRPYPVQEQDCRCQVEKKGFQFNAQSYYEKKAPYTLSYLGAFRGSPITQLSVNLAQYDASSNSVTLLSDVNVSANTPEYSFEREEYTDYLIITPASLADGLTEFVNWKKSNGYNVTVETVASPNNTTAAITALVKQHYDNGADFVILVGNETTLPMFKVSTSGSYQTPSDLKYYTMDGPNDYVPDLFFSRIAATTSEQVAAQLAKSIEFEQKSYRDASGLKRIVGIASNEGYNPSDDEYVKGIGDSFKNTLSVEVTHLYQGDTQNSNPATLNNKLNEGAFWLTYMGHGSGTSWASMARSYSTTNIKQINNKSVVKPIIIDVACMNGKLAPGYFGATFLEANSTSAADNFGAAAYYGGTVNISWHPPAVMAQGIASEHMQKNFKHLGEALLAGQLYLAAKWNRETEVIDNFEWYHLQGDPGMNVQFQ